MIQTILSLLYNIYMYLLNKPFIKGDNTMINETNENVSTNTTQINIGYIK